MKKIKYNNIAILSYGRKGSTRCPNKVLRKFDKTTVVDIILKKFDKNELLGTAFILKFSASIISILLIYFNIFQFEDSEIRNLSLIIVFTLIFQNFNIIDVFFQANVISKFAVISNLIVSIFSSIIKLSLVYYEMSLVFFAYSIVFDSLMISYSDFLVRRGHCTPKFIAVQ